MISNEELQKKIQTVTYQIINESLSDAEKTAMNLTSEQIIPTINFFNKVQTILFTRFCEDKAYLGHNVEFECYYIDWDFKTQQFFTNPEVISVNLPLLNCLCQDRGIVFYTYEDRLHFDCPNGQIYNNIKKKSLL